MDELTYFQGTEGKCFPFLEKNGLRIVAKPLGADIIDEAERIAAKGCVHVGSDTVHGNEGTIDLEIGAAGLPGYNISFPTELSIRECYKRMLPWLPTNFYAFLNFEANDKKIIAIYESGDDSHKREFGFTIFDKDRELEERLKGMLNGKNLDEMLNDKEFSEILTASLYPVLHVGYNGSQPEKGKLPFFWHETNGDYEDETPFDKAITVNVEQFDMALFGSIAELSSFQLTEIEFSWLQRLFEERGSIFRYHLSGSN